MQLHNLKITNFRTIEEMSFNPGKINVITGPNGAGKSSILEAISFLLTGKAGTDVVRKGAAFAEVSGTVNGGDIARKKGKEMSIKMNGKLTTQKSFQQWVEDATGITADTLRVATSSGMLASMNSRELAEYLINNNLIPVEIDMATLKMLCAISEKAETELNKYLPPEPCTFTTDDVQQAYEAFYAMRPALKKQIAEMKAKASGAADATPMRTMDEVDKDIAKLSAYGTEVAAYNKLLAAYQDAKRRREAAEKQIAEMEVQVKNANLSAPDAQELEKLQAEAKVLMTEQIGYYKQVIQTSTANLSMFKRTLENLDKPVCPISEKLICTTDKTGIKEDLTVLVKENEARIEETNRLLNAANEKLDAVNKRIDEFHKQERAYMALQNTVMRIDAMSRSLPVVPSKPERPVEIPDAENTMRKLKQERDSIIAKGIAAKAAEEIPAIQEKLDICEELVKLLSPKGGLREQIIKAAFEPLVEHCNERAAKLGRDFEIDLVANDGIVIMCKPAGTTEFLPLEAVSSGEQLLAMMLILDAIESLSGLGIMVLDDLDKLDADALDALFSLLGELDFADSYDHIFVAMVNHEDALRVIENHKESINNHIAF